MPESFGSRTLLILILCFWFFPLKAQTDNTSPVVFGFLPDWVYLENHHADIRYDLLTHLAVFPFTFDSSGTIYSPQEWVWEDIKTHAAEFDVKLIACVANFDSNNISYLFHNEESRLNFLQNLLQVIEDNGFEGVNIDFEPLGKIDEGIPVINFMREVSDSVKSHFPESEISFSTPIVNWDNDWDFYGLAEICDYLFVMGYGFFGSWSQITGPVTPITGGNYNLTRSIEYDYSSVVNEMPFKIVLGLPYFGHIWKTTSDLEGASVVEYVDWKPYSYVDSLGNNAIEMWSDRYNVSWYKWKDSNNVWNQLWIDNARSFELKLDLIINKNLLGLGIWALGFDYNTSDLWDAIDQKLLNPNSLENDQNLIADYKLLNNFPNPFNPSTNIEFYIPEEGYTELVIYDLLGQEVAELLSQRLNAGWHSTRWNACNNSGSKVSSGSYIYQLRRGEVVIYKKMLLLK